MANIAVISARRRRRMVSAGGGGAFITDSFNRADNAASLGSTDGGSLGPKAWTVQGGTWGVISNTAYQVSGVVDSGVTVAHNSADGTIAVTVATFVNEARLLVRCTSLTSYILIRLSGPSGIEVYTVNPGFVLLGSAAATPASGDVLSVVLSGTSIIAKQNGVTKVSVTSSVNQAVVNHGFGGSTSERFDNFSIS